jgi:uncharacterized protein
MLTAKQIIEKFEMEPLRIEGGFIKVVDVSDEIIRKDALPSRYDVDKPIYGTILYLITPDSFSKMHFLPTDEVYHFYLGDPVEQLQLLEDGTGRIVRLGQDILNGECVQSIAPANAWHGSRLVEGGSFALMGTTMAPAYSENEYIHGVRQTLIEKFPEFKQAIIDRT